MTTRGFFLAALSALAALLVCYSQLANRTRDKNSVWATKSTEKSIIEVQDHDTTTSHTSQHLSIAPGELPGYTGWPRREYTLAGYFVTKPYETTVEAGEDWYVTLECQGHADCATATSWFFVRAYGPAIITGVVENLHKGSYRIRLRPIDPGDYTVEVVTTFSNPPPIEEWPRDEGSPRVTYEGYLVQGFPLTLSVQESPSRPSKFSVCQVSDLVETSPVSAYDKGRWKVVDQNRVKDRKQVRQGIDLEGYRQSYNSLAIQLKYEFNSCQLMGRPGPQLNPYMCLQKPTRIIVIGDSNLRLQTDLLHQYAKGNPNIRISFTEIKGGALRCRHFSEPNVDEILELEAQVENERRIVIFNTGLHDVHRLCSAKYAEERESYLPNPNMSCLELYGIAVRSLADAIQRIHAEVKIFQTTTAAWQKYGNYGVQWSPRYGQVLPMDAGFIDRFNQKAFEVLQPYNYSIVDGYWISLARPDHRQVDQMSDIRKKLSHPGVSIIEMMTRMWTMLVLLKLC